MRSVFTRPGSNCMASGLRAKVEVAWDSIQGAGNGQNHDPSVAAEGHVLMTPGGRGLFSGVGQGPCAPKVERHVPPIASVQVKVRGEAVHTGPQCVQ